MTDLEMRKLAECTREELIDMIIKLDKQVESNNSLKESIAKGIKEGLTPSIRVYGTTGPLYVESNNDYSFAGCSYATTTQLDDFKRLAKEAQELNKEIDFVIHDKYIDYNFISGKDDRFKVGQLKVLDPFNVTQEDITKTKTTLDRLDLVKQGFKYGDYIFGNEKRIEGFNNACNSIKDTISNLKLKKKNKITILGIVDQIQKRGF